MMGNCIRLKRGVCRLDLKPCGEKCPLKKTKVMQDWHLAEVKIEEVNLRCDSMRKAVESLRKDLITQILTDYMVNLNIGLKVIVK